MQSSSSIFSTIIGIPAKAWGNLGGIRYASKKASKAAKQGSKGRPSHHGLKLQDNRFAQAGNILVKQRGLRFFPGLNVGFGKYAYLFAMEPGRVVVTCEKVDPNWNHPFVVRTYGSRKNAPPLYKKYYNVLPFPQHNRFKLIETV